MKRTLILLVGLLLARAAPGCAQTVTNDTLLGHAQLVHRLSQSLCAQLTSDHTTDLECVDS